MVNLNLCSPREIGNVVISQGKFVVNLKKQTQFVKGQNERKYLLERVL